MDAPHFDRSDAANWISRVQYYFDHMMIPETDRLHYVVMLFDPPASEWILIIEQTMVLSLGRNFWKMYDTASIHRASEIIRD